MADGEAAKGVVLVTGGSGYIGGWCVIGLLQQGYTVRATVRNLAREGQVRASLGKAVEIGDRLSFHAADLMSDDGWDVAPYGFNASRMKLWVFWFRSSAAKAMSFAGAAATVSRAGGISARTP